MEKVFLYNKILSHCTSEFNPIMLGGLKIDPVVFHFTHEKDDFHVSEHYHPLAELSWMLNGPMEYVLEGQSHKISAKDKKFIFIPPGTVHKRNFQERGSCIIGFMLDIAPYNAKGRIFLDDVNSFLAESGYVYDSLPFINEFESKLLKELNDGKRVFIGKINFLIYEFLFKLFSYFFADYLFSDEEEHKITYDWHNIVWNTQDYIDKNLDAKLSIKSFAQRYNLSPRHLSRIFSEQTGVSLRQYILQRKLAAAKKMLYNPRFSVKEISVSLGFNSESYFCSFFKKQTGKTPKQYAENVNKD